MEVYIFSKNFEPLAAIDYAASIIVSRYYNQLGDFELYVPVTEEALEVLKINNFVLVENDTQNLMIIKNVKIETDLEDSDYITATGVFADVFIKNRIAWGLNQVSGTMAECIRKLLEENLISPEDDARRNPLFKISSLAAGGKMTKQSTGGNLLEIIEEILSKEEMGHKTTFDGEFFYFSTYKGKDRSYNQTVNSPVIFSPDFDNLLATEYEADASEFANVALVAGEGEGIERKMAAVGTASGMDRIEDYVDARQLSSETEEPLTEEEYSNVLKEKGLEKLSEHEITEDFEAEIEPGVVYQYRQDYELGDVVTVINEYGLRVDSRIIQTIESWDENGYKLILKFEKKER